MTLQGSVALAFHRNAVALDVGLSALAGAKDDVNGVPFGFRHIAFVEFFFISDFYYFEAFLDEVGREGQDDIISYANAGRVDNG